MPFCEVAEHLNDAAKPASNETWVQHPFRDVTLDYLAFIQSIISILPTTDKLVLRLDRTEWDIGQGPVNIPARARGRRCGARALVLGITRQPQWQFQRCPAQGRARGVRGSCWAASGLTWCWGTANLWAKSG